MRIVLTALLITIVLSCHKEPVNQPPVAAFSVEPSFGDTETRFVFDGSLSTDPDQEDSLLWVRWDWEGDGIYDSYFVQTKIHTRQFEQIGNYTVRMQVRDNEGVTDTSHHQISVHRGSAAPLEPFAPNPRDSANNIVFNGRLSWVGVDPDDDPMVYDVYLGTTSDPPLVATDLIIDEYYPAGIIPGELYYWRVVVRDELLEETSGPVWRFSTHSGSYITDTLVDTRDGEVYKTLLLNGRWWMTENLRYKHEGYSHCYDDLEENCKIYGHYYYAGTQDSVICPEGWRYPSRNEWDELEAHLGMERSDINRYGVWRGSDQADQLIVGGSSGLNFLHTGYRDDEGNWQYFGERFYFGITTGRAASRMAIKGYGGILKSYHWEARHVPVRCIK